MSEIYFKAKSVYKYSGCSQIKKIFSESDPQAFFDLRWVALNLSEGAIEVYFPLARAEIFFLQVLVLLRGGIFRLLFSEKIFLI